MTRRLPTIVRAWGVAAVCFCAATPDAASARATDRDAAPQQVTAPPAPQPIDGLAEARRLATAGRRPDALALLQRRLADRPDDVDARTLLGIMLSWDGRYTDARTELRKVLETNPGYYDAVAALANIELWDGQAEMAVSLAGSVLRRNAKDTAVLLTKARAEVSLSRVREARDTLDRLLAIEPGNLQAIDLRTRLHDNARYWSVGYGFTADWFSDRRTPWHEQSVTIKRQAGFGAVSATWFRATRYGLADQQLELEVYPRLWAGTYLYLDAGGSVDQVLYPSYRAGAHLYQSLGGGFEASVGMSRLGFGNGINIYIGSLSKYVGRWLIINQIFVTPQTLGTNLSYHVALRRYLTDKEYLGVRYHHGAAKEDIRTINDVRVLNGDGVSAEAVLLLGTHVGLTCQGAFKRQERALSAPLTQYSATARLDVRF